MIDNPTVHARETKKARELQQDAKLSGRILVVEDNIVNQKLLRFTLERRGATVEVANNGVEALEKYSENKFDLIVMDIQMPIMDGYETLHAMQSQGINVPVVALTANAMKGDREKCLRAGFTTYLQKPVTRGDLIKAVAGLFQTQRV